MPFLYENINRAILVTQGDLEEFPPKLKEGGMNRKSLYDITCGFMPLAAGLKKEGGRPTDDSYVSVLDSSFEQYLTMARQLAADCDPAQKETIRQIITDIIRRSRLMQADLAAGRRKSAGYLPTLSKNNDWGKVVLALAEAFDTRFQQAVA